MSNIRFQSQVNHLWKYAAGIALCVCTVLLLTCVDFDHSEKTHRRLPKFDSDEWWSTHLNALSNIIHQDERLRTHAFLNALETAVTAEQRESPNFRERVLDLKTKLYKAVCADDDISDATYEK